MKSASFPFALSLLLLFSFCSCKKFEDESLTLPRQPYQGQQLRTDGYYYFVVPKDIYMPEDVTIKIYVLYRNGIHYQIALGGPDSAAMVERHLSNPDFVGRSEKQRWGLFNIDSSQIKVEYFSTGSFGKRFAMLYKGQILSDTTFVLGEFADSFGLGALSDTFRFKRYQPKPDSTNPYL